MSFFANPLFGADSTDKLEVVDAYDLDNSRPINKLYEASINKSEALYERAGGAVGIIDGTDRILVAKESGSSGAELLEMGLGILGSSSAGILRTVGSSVIDKAGEFVDLDPSMSTRIKDVAGNIVNVVTNGDPKAISNYGELASLVGDLSGSPELAHYINVGYESAVWAAVITDAVGYGDSSLYKNLRGKVDPEVYYRALIYSIPAVASSGSLEALVNLLQELEPEVIMANNPDFIEVFISSYRIDKSKVSDIQAHVHQTSVVLDGLDATWAKTVVNHDKVIYNLAILSLLKEEGYSAFCLHSELGPAAQLARVYKTEPVATVLREQYPRMVTNLQ